MQFRKLIRTILRESISQDQIKQLMLSGHDIESFIKAISLTYGNTIPLFHATTLEKAAIIDVEGLKLTYGKNYKSITNEMNLYFKIGQSTYQSSNRPIVYKWMAPLQFIERFAYADIDSINTTDEDLLKLGLNPESMSSDFNDLLCSFIDNNYSFNGMELLIENRDGDNSFPIIKPQRIS